jgi:hypothetical protein
VVLAMMIPYMQVGRICLHVVGPEPSDTPESPGVLAIYHAGS